MICVFDPTLCVRLAVAHHFELFAAKNGKILSGSAMPRSENRAQGSERVEVRRRRLRTEAIFPESPPVRPIKGFLLI